MGDIEKNNNKIIKKQNKIEKKKNKKEEIKKEIYEDNLRIKKSKVALKLEKIEDSIDDVISYIEKNNIEIETEQKNKINSISENLQQVKNNIEKVEEDIENSRTSKKKGFTIMGISIWRIFAYFIIYSILGYIVETTFAFIAGGVIESRQSFLYGPFCAIYGLGAVVMIVGLQKFKKKNLYLIIGSILLGAVTEYLVSLVGEVVFGVKWWDYSDMAFNIHGRICATYSIAWGALGWILFRYINPKIDRFINFIPTQNLKTITATIMIFLILDWGISSLALEIFYVRMAETQNIEIQTDENQLGKKLYENPIVKAISNTLWSDRVMIKTFPNLRVTTKSGAVIYVSNLYKNINPYYVKVFEPVLFDLREEQMTHK